MKQNFWLIVFSASMLLAGAVYQNLGPGERGIIANRNRADVLVKTGFEPGDTVLALQQHEPATGPAHTGKSYIVGKVTKPKQTAILKVPFQGMKNRRLDLSFWVSSPDKVRCTVFVIMDGQPRKSIFAIDGVKKQWTEIRASASPTTDQAGFFEIIAPSSHGGPIGEARVDDVQLTAADPQSDAYKLDHVESFPALTTDGAGKTWLAALARPLPRKQIRLFRIEGPERVPAGIVEPEGVTGLGGPVLAPLADGVLLAAAVEQKDSWRILWTKIKADAKDKIACQYLEAGGHANTAPALAAMKDRVCLVWEASGADVENHGVYAAFIGADGNPTKPQRISSAKFVSTHPQIVALADGRLFAAWDSCRDKNVDLYGAWYQDGQWQPETRLTQDPRIERHVHLAAWKDQVWLAWQAQSFPKNNCNSMREQRIVVAQLSAQGLLSTPDMFNRISPEDDLLLHPQLAFDPQGRLWLTARRSISQHDGWQPLTWCLSGGAWSTVYPLWPERGRWTPAVMTFGPQGGLAACQRDDFPPQGGLGNHGEWHSEIVIVPLPVDRAPAPQPLAVSPLKMPATDFNLAAHMDAFSVFLPRQTATANGRRLGLYWGDMHNHTDISVCARNSNPPMEDLYANNRDLERLDFTAITDHDYNFDHAFWDYNAERVRAFYDPGQFVTLLGEEWTSDQLDYNPPRPYRRYGHRNMIFQNTYFNRSFNSRDGDIPPTKVWNELTGIEFIAIPHQLADTGNCPTDWTYHDELHQPVAEVFQTRQSYECFEAVRQAKGALPFKGHFIQDAWELGIIIGVTASPDHGGGMGKTGVWTEDLTRENLFKAFHARHTFGTTGAKLALFVQSDANLMGDKVLRAGAGPIPFHIQGASDRPIAKVTILRNNQPVYEATPNAHTINFDWRDEKPLDAKVAWYYVRLQRADEELAWSSPIWFFKNQTDLDATIEFARRLPTLYPHGVPIPDKHPPLPPKPQKNKGGTKLLTEGGE